jgi:hypothetical protein
MARARNIKPGFFKNEDLAECSPWARLCFAGLWTLADREGRLEDRPKRIKGELFAFDTIDVEPLLKELERFKFIVRYETDGMKAIQISEFARHQSPHYSEIASVIKPPSLPESTEKDTPIKEGSQPPDSLIPDSLNPEQETVASAAPNRPPPFDGKNFEALNGRAVVRLADEWELPEQWGFDAEALGWQPAEVLREAEKLRQWATQGKGKGTRRNVKGWRQTWSNWLEKAARDKR